MSEPDVPPPSPKQDDIHDLAANLARTVLGRMPDEAIDALFAEAREEAMQEARALLKQRLVESILEHAVRQVTGDDASG